MSEHSPAWPKARVDDLVTEAVGDELVVYDGLTKEAHCLTPVAAAVFGAADGHTTIDAIAAIAAARLGEPVGTDSVEQAIAELEDRDLIVTPGDDLGGLSRRSMLRKTAVAGGAVLVASIATPELAAAVSPHTNLSYVAVMITCGTTAYRMKFDRDGNLTDCNTFATPGQSGDCTLTHPAGTTLDPGCLAGVTVQENPVQGTVTITYPSTCRLRDYIVKCANDCKGPAGDPNAASPQTVTGCP
jgi:hypothetical protein